MTNHTSIHRLGGLAALLGVGFAIVFMGIFIAVGPNEAPAGVLETVARTSALVAPILYVIAAAALYFDLRLEAGFLALAALAIFGGSDLVGLFFDPLNFPPVPWGILTVVHGFGIALFGVLQFRSSNYPKGMGILALVAGILFSFAGIAMVVTGDVTSIGPLAPLVMLSKNIWLAWLGWRLLKGQAAELRPVQA